MRYVLSFSAGSYRGTSRSLGTAPQRPQAKRDAPLVAQGMGSSITPGATRPPGPMSTSSSVTVRADDDGPRPSVAERAPLATRARRWSGKPAVQAVQDGAHLPRRHHCPGRHVRRRGGRHAAGVARRDRSTRRPGTAGTCRLVTLTLRARHRADGATKTNSPQAARPARLAAVVAVVGPATRNAR